MKTLITITSIFCLSLFAACGIEEETVDETPAATCGDGTCDEGECSESCPADCPKPAPTPVCGDGKCETGETAVNCASDCYKPTCGDGKCEAGETSLNCLKDCPLGVVVIPVPTPTYLPDPVKVVGKCELLLSNYYVSGSSCGELLGNLPGVNWTTGMSLGDANKDGYYEAHLNASTMVAGTYEFSWKGYQDCSGKLPKEAWAQYGAKTQLAQMKVEARKCLYCNWIADDGSEKSVTNPSCGSKVTIASDCSIQCAGNAHLLKL